MRTRDHTSEPGRLCHALILAVVVSSSLLAATAGAASPLDEETLIREADARIERHRKADGLVRIVDAEGKPVAGAVVKVEQTRHAFLFGCNIFMWGHCQTPEMNKLYEQQFADVFNYATLPFYWWGYEPQEGKPQYTRSEQVARWCHAHGIATKGHPLAWNYGEPAWLPDDPQRVLSLQVGRVGDCVKRLSRLIDRWDVVNEAAQYNREMLKKQAPKLTLAWERAGQMAFTRKCFEAARAASGGATLLINDYDTSPAYEKVIERLVDGNGKPLYDVIGIQSHMHGGVWPAKNIWEVCERFSRFGVPLHFTETTLLSGEQGWELADKRPGFKWTSTPDGLKRQAEQTEHFYSILFSHPAVEAITWWDFSDSGAWQQAPAGWLTSDMKPKPVYDVMRRLIRQKWFTRLDLKTGPDGRAAFRGFKGRYLVTAVLPDARTISGEFELPGSTPWQLAQPRNPAP